MTEKNTESVLIQAQQISLIREQRLLFKNISFTLCSGEALHVVGANGSGKTSLMKLIAGVIVPTKVTMSGSLSVFGKSPLSREPDDFRQLLFLGHQTAIKPTLSVIENLRFNAALFDALEASDDELEYALSRTGLLPFAQQMAATLSAGQQRRVMLARLWLCVGKTSIRKKIWLLDEPFTALDAAVVGALQELIDAQLARGGSVVITSHQPFTLAHPVATVCLDRDIGIGIDEGGT